MTEGLKKGALLIAKELSGQLSLLDKSQTWNVVDIDLKISCLKGAVYVGNTLYVQGYEGKDCYPFI